MIILSFDVGIRNLAYCQLDTITKDILDWNILDCTASNVIVKLVEELENVPNLLDSQIILIEKQPSFNPKMRIISTAIYVYFTLRLCYEQNKNIKIMYYAAKHKLKLCNETEALQNKTNSKTKKAKKRNYYLNKKAAVEHTKYLLERQNSPFLDYFLKSKKKDDLADSYLQALAYLN